MRVKARNRVIYYLVFLLLFFYMDSFFAKIMGASERVRLPRFAGTWYPSQSTVLDKNLSNYLREAKTNLLAKNEQRSDAIHNKDDIGENILALIVPHAGYTFSGKTAAYAYQALGSNKHRRVFLLGPSHHIAFKGVVFPSEDAFETPLGEIQIDRSTVHKLLQKPYFNEADAVFDSEHSLEMQLPWIRKTLGKVKLVPMAIGTLGREEIKSIADSIKNELSDGDLLIISSDFTHYGPRFEYEPFGESRQNALIEAKIKELDLQAFDCLKSLDSQALLNFYARTGDTICGIYPAALLLALLPRQSKTFLANYSTSQDFERDPAGNSVSYMAIVFSAPDNKNCWTKNKKKITKTQSLLSESEGKSLLKLARLSLEDYLKGKRENPLEYAAAHGLNNERFLANHGVFVTLYKKSICKQEHEYSTQEIGKQLRGCIGYIYPNKPVLVGVCENAINAASNDPRFSPVTVSEMNDLVIEISILTAPQYISDWRNINLGKDGIVFHKSGKQSVFLPKVASEFGWDLPQTLSQLSVKAGLSPFDWQNDAQFEVFQSQSFSE